MHKVIDCPWDLTQHAGRLKADGVEVAIRYYNHANSSRLPQKRIERSEYDTLLDAGLSLAIVFQQTGGASGHIEDLDSDSGIKDAERALSLAGTYGQPENSAIYFAVDHDYYIAEHLTSIKAYFQSVSKTLKGKYRVGVYGSGTVGKSVRDAGFADFIWLAAGIGWSGTKSLLKTDQWALYQLDSPEIYEGIGYDGNFVGARWKDFGQFGREPTDGTFELGASMALSSAISTHSELAVVIASGGLNLRRGPGESFGIERLLPQGTSVVVTERSGDWAKVDINGDGKTDGYVHSGFLKVQSGGFPLTDIVGKSPYEIAKAELAQTIVEVPGPGNNPRIVMYHRSTNHWSGTDDSVAWCSSFVNFCVEQAGLIGTDRQDAQSWKSWGEDVSAAPQEGDIAVFARGGSKGHVGFFVSDLGSHIKVLGGNQSGRVCYQAYPKNGKLGSETYKLLGIRRG